MDSFESELIARMKTSTNLSARRFLKWLEKNPIGPARKRRLNKLKADAQHILKEDADGAKLFRGNGVDSLTAIDWDSLFEKLLPFIKLILSLFM